MRSDVLLLYEAMRCLTAFFGFVVRPYSQVQWTDGI